MQQQYVPWDKIRSLEDEIKALKALGKPEPKKTKKAKPKKDPIEGILKGIEFTDEDFEEAKKCGLTRNTYFIRDTTSEYSFRYPFSKLDFNKRQKTYRQGKKLFSAGRDSLYPDNSINGGGTSREAFRRARWHLRRFR